VRKLHERRWRDKLGLFVCEGEDLVAAATAEPIELLVAGANVEASLLAEVSTAAHAPRVIGVYRREDLPGAEPRPVALALWRVADPGNVGTLIRTAGAFGAAVALSDGCADPTGPKALRASAGAIWSVPLVPFGNLRYKRVALIAHGGVPLEKADLSGEVAFVLGAEREGLPAEIERDLEVTIPIESESLNVAAAGAIGLYEWHRQNRPAPPG
jgi:TrmH family RNA methyltransferase